MLTPESLNKHQSIRAAAAPWPSRRPHLAGACKMLPTLMTGLFLAAIAPSIALAMRVGGTLVSPTGQPVASRDLHFQNCITGDIYLSPTHGDGSFGAQLPPGCYQLRSETGAIVEEPIIVTDSDLALGRLPENSPNYLLRVWQSQSIFPSLLTSPAPSTAFILTRDTTVSLLPPTAVAVPMPSSESEWLKLQSQSVSMNPVATPPPATALGSPNAMSEITAPDLGPIPAHPRDIFTEPSFNPEQPVATPPAGASKPSPYQ